MSPSSVFQKINLPQPTGQAEGDFDASTHDASSNGPVFGSPVYTFSGGSVPFNTHIREMIEVVDRYYSSRGKLVSKASKFPHIEDYREGIRDMDEKQAISVRHVIMEIRNHYAVLHDMIVKNIDRIKVPRSNNTISMY
nr:unnamed protein product [Spirometra erinaceieuropaei]